MRGRQASIGGAVALVMIGALVAGAQPASAKSCDGAAVACAIGDTGPGGGIVFYDAGSPQVWGRYLEAAPPGWSGNAADPKFVWCPMNAVGVNTVLPTGTEIGWGGRNTKLIVNRRACGKRTAAGRAAGYSGGGLADWFLPSKDELNALYAQRQIVGGLGDVTYWSSSQFSGQKASAWGHYILTGFQDGWAKTAPSSVRPIRAF